MVNRGKGMLRPVRPTRNAQPHGPCHPRCSHTYSTCTEASERASGKSSQAGSSGEFSVFSSLFVALDSTSLEYAPSASPKPCG